MILLKHDESNGVDIIQHYEETLQKSITLPAIHVVLKRMEKKGWVASRFGEPTSQRGGRRKRIYWATPSGYYAIKSLQEAKISLWNSIIKPAYKYGY